MAGDLGINVPGLPLLLNLFLSTVLLLSFGKSQAALRPQGWQCQPLEDHKVAMAQARPTPGWLSYNGRRRVQAELRVLVEADIPKSRTCSLLRGTSLSGASNSGGGLGCCGGCLGGALDAAPDPAGRADTRFLRTWPPPAKPTRAGHHPPNAASAASAGALTMICRAGCSSTTTWRNWRGALGECALRAAWHGGVGGGRRKHLCNRRVGRRAAAGSCWCLLCWALSVAPMSVHGTLM